MINGCTTISVIVPVYKGNYWLEANLASLAKQTHDNWRFEVIYIVNTSETSERELLLLKDVKNPLHGYPWLNLKIINKNQDRVETNWNLGIKLAQGDYITWMGQDDTLYPDALINGSSYLETHLNIDIVYGHHYVTRSKFQDNNIWKHTNIGLTHAPEFDAGRLLKGNFIFSGTFLVRKSVYEKIGFYRTEQYVVPDYEFWIRAYKNGFKFAKGDYVTCNIHNHDDSAYYTWIHKQEEELNWLHGEYLQKEFYKEYVPIQEDIIYDVI